MYTTKIFQDDKGQVLCIPSGLETDKENYCIDKIGSVYIAYPVDDPWISVREVVGSFSDDFMKDRKQPSWKLSKKETLI